MQLFVGAVSFGSYYLLGRQDPNGESKKNGTSLSTTYTVVSAGAMKLEGGRLCSTVNDHHATFSEFTHSEEVTSQHSVPRGNKEVSKDTGAASKIKYQGDTSESESKKVKSRTTVSQKSIAPPLLLMLSKNRLRYWVKLLNKVL